VEFQLRRQEMLTVQHSEAGRVRRRLEMEHDQQELNASQSADNTSVLVCWLVIILTSSAVFSDLAAPCKIQPLPFVRASVV